MTPASTQVTGVLLCRAADHRIAFAASDVASVEPRASDLELHPSARRAFGLSDATGRVLISPAGDAVVVDMLEVMQGLVSVLPCPAALAANAGGALLGFVAAKDQLWPLLGVSEFSRFLHQLPKRATLPPGTERF